MVFFLILMLCKNVKYSWYVGTAVAGVAFLVLAYFSKTIVTNESENIIKVKPENACEPLVDVEPGTKHVGLDGIKSNGRVFKARNGTHIIVKKNGNITTKSLTGKMANSFLTRAGYISKNPDSCWESLFNS